MPRAIEEYRLSPRGRRWPPRRRGPEFLDDGATGVRLLVEDHRFQASPLDEAGQLGLCGSVVPVNDEHFLGRLAAAQFRTCSHQRRRATRRSFP